MLHFTAADHPEAQSRLADCITRYGQTDIGHAHAIVALGGDGFLLEIVHKAMLWEKPVYGMNCGSVGFMTNPYRLENLQNHVENSCACILHPLAMRAWDSTGLSFEAIAFNEVYVLRKTRQAAKLKLTVNKKTRLDELICDGVIVSTPFGSTAYNLSAHGPILPIDSHVLALTPISAFRPRRWRGAILSHQSVIEIDILESAKRPITTVADHLELNDIIKLTVAEEHSKSVTLLFDSNIPLSERIAIEQFLT